MTVELAGGSSSRVRGSYPAGGGRDGSRVCDKACRNQVGSYGRQGQPRTVLAKSLQHFHFFRTPLDLRLGSSTTELPSLAAECTSTVCRTKVKLPRVIWMY